MEARVGTLRGGDQRLGLAVDAAGVAVILLGLSWASFCYAARLLRKDPRAYRRFRQNLGRAILLGLELLVAGDIIRTVGVSPTLRSVAVLGLIVLIRTFLSFSIEVELKGRWPWSGRRDGA